MKRSTTRRNFLRDTSLTATGLAVVSFTNKKDAVKTVIGCAPTKITFLSGSITSVKSGSWSDPATWGGKVPTTSDTPLISSGHIVTYDAVSGTFTGVNVNAGGTLQFDPSKSCELKSNKNIVIEGILEMKPQDSSKIHLIQFINVNESAFVGGGMTPIASDIGLWVIGTGKLNITGATKTSWTNALGSVNAGSTSIAVKDTSGWNVGDEIVISPTDRPDGGGLDFDELAGEPIDPFLNKFERRIISAVNGNTISFTLPLKYDHLSVSSNVTSSELGRSSSKIWTAEVANLTRNARIEGTREGRAHIFISSKATHVVKYLQGKYLGPRKYQGGRRKELVTGRYGLHFHHCNYGSQGSVVEGCAFYEMGNRTYVPHVSHGISFYKNVSFKSLESAFWWDFSDVTHETIYDGNLVMAVLHNGVAGKSGITLVLGDRNVCKNNVAVYAHIGDTHGSGAFSWEPNSVGVWVFENNLAHSNHGGAFIWDNGPNNHFVKNFDTYNNQLACFLGAYGNIWTFFGGHHYNSPFGVKATSVNTFGVVLKDIFMDAGGASHCVITETSAIRGNDHSTNKFIGCVFRNFSKKVALNYGGGEPKWVDFINCDIPNGANANVNLIDWVDAIDNFTTRIQPKNAKAFQLQKLGSILLSNVSDFAARNYGTGEGLKGEYYLGKNFDKHLFTRLDPALTFQTWSTGVDNLIPLGAAWSARWTGWLEPQFTETHAIRVLASGGFRLWLNDKLVLDRWFEAEHKSEYSTATLPLTTGQKVKFKLEQFHSSKAAGMQLYWKAPSMKYEQIIMQCQLYSDAIASTAPQPLANQAPYANAGQDIVISLPTNSAVLNGTSSTDPDGTLSSYKWTKVSGPLQYSIVDDSKPSAELKNLVQGTYVFNLKVTDDKGATSEDQVMVTVNPQSADTQNQKPIANAGADIVITLPVNSITLNGTSSKDLDGTIKSFKWLKVSGPTQYTIVNAGTSTTAVNNLVQGTYVFRLQVVDDKGATSEDDVTVIVNPATGKTSDTSSSQPAVQTLKATVSPNPTTSVFNVNVQSGSTAPIVLSLFNRYGVLIGRMTVGNNSTTSVGSGLRSGTYYGVAEQGTQKISMTLIKL